MMTYRSNNNIASYAYDQFGMRTSLTLGSGITSYYSYDPLNRLTKIFQSTSMTAPALASYTYLLDAQGNRVSVTEADGSSTAWTYDNDYHLLTEQRQAGSVNVQPPTQLPPPILVRPTQPPSTPSGGSVPGGNQIGGSDVHPAPSLPQSQLDPVMLLHDIDQQGASTTPAQSGGSSPLSGGAPGWNTSYTYDPVGNRSSMTDHIANTTTSYNYNGLNQLTSSMTGSLTNTYTYNSRGDLVNSTVQQPTGGPLTTTFTWGVRDRLTGISSSAGSSGFAYDDAGHRVQAISGGQTVNYLWDTLSAYGDVIQESDGSNNILASYTLGDGELLTEQRTTVTSYALHDGQNSIRTLTNASGGVTDSYLYDAYGNTRNHTGSTVNPYQYGGQQTSDSFSGL